MNAFPQEGIERTAQRKGKVVAIGKVGEGQANEDIDGPAMHPPMKEGGIHGKARGLRRLAVDPFRRGRSKMQQRLRDPEEEQPDADTGAKQHGKPGEPAVLRLRVIGPQAHGAKAGKGEVQHEDEENGDAQHVEPAEGVDDPPLNGAEHLRREGRHRRPKGRHGHDEARRHPEHHGVHHHLRRFFALPSLGAVRHYSAPAW